ncbi:crispr-associated helicase Cas3 domain protein, putative [Thermosipho africanus TCF52B]|uniref:Crispr-associated helicase Cas3 domain protein, putative n=2 Tax=Thermosipho TaxID=2420 RepID=B7IEF2_THEAB|nr:crispr-associated helicase Cas3 domain protein, putative [Thermosipho africanus TCF52B]
MKLFTFSKSIDDKMAHKKDEKFEPFIEHVRKTKNYLEELIEKYGIEEILKNLFYEFKISDSYIETVYEIIKYHDIGKLTEEFQNGLKLGDISITHSDIGFYTISSLLVDKVLSKKLSNKEFVFLLLIATVVSRHHSFLSDISDIIFWNEEKEKYVRYILEFLETENDKDTIINMTKSVFGNLNMKKIKKVINIEFFLLYKLLNSLLITCDYLATMEFMKGVKFVPKIIDDYLKDIILNNISSSKINGNFNPYIDKKINKFRTMKKEEVFDLNTLRSVITAKIEEKFEKSKKNVFFIEVPTGGGKTNISLRLVRKLLEKKKKVFYVIPYVNIIEQSFDYFSKFIPGEYITRYDHKYIDIADDENKEKSYTQTLFLNFPFVFTTHVGFFDMFFRKGKSDNFNFYQIANSVIILDEVQAYNPKFWNTLSNIFYYLSKYLNTTIIIMSATLPDFTKFIEKENFVENLTPDVVDHKLFERASYVFLDKDIEEKILEEVNKSKKTLVVVNTVKESYRMYENLKSKIDGEVYILNSTLLYVRKRELIDYIKKYNKEKPLVLVSTQSIEAGVDLDFDVGFRAFSLLDSIIQTMGRVNRNARLKSAKLYLFDDGNWKRIYKSDEREKILEENFSKFKSGKLKLNEFYSLTIEKLKKKLNAFTLDYLDYFKDLKFKNIDKELKLIDGDTFSLFIPLEIPLSKLNNIKKLLLEYNLISDKDKVLQGKKVWNVYMDNDFSYVENRLFSKIFSLFVVSLYNYRTEGKSIKEILKDEMNEEFYFAEDFEKYYSYKDGLNVEKFLELKSSREYDFL